MFFAELLGSLIALVLHQATLAIGLVVGLSARRQWWACIVGGLLTSCVINLYFRAYMAERLGIPGPDGMDFFVAFVAGALVTVMVQGIVKLASKRMVG